MKLFLNQTEQSPESFVSQQNRLCRIVDTWIDNGSFVSFADGFIDRYVDRLIDNRSIVSQQNRLCMIVDS